MTRFSDAALLRGDFAHHAKEFRAGHVSAPKRRDWKKVANDSKAEAAAQEIAKHIFDLQQQIDDKNEKIEITHYTALGPMRVMAVVPGDGDVLRVDGILLESGEPVAQAMHASQLSLTFSKAPLVEEEAEDDGLEIGFVIFDELKERRKKRDKKVRKLSLSTSSTQSMAKDKAAKPKRRTAKKTHKADRK